MVGFIFGLLYMGAFLLGILSAELDYRNTMGKFPFKTNWLERHNKKLDKKRKKENERIKRKMQRTS